MKAKTLHTVCFALLLSLLFFSLVQEKLGLVPSGTNWVEQVSGSLADIPEDDYQQFLECCRAVRGGVTDCAPLEPG